MVDGPRSPGSVATKAEPGPSADDPLRRATPTIDDVERRQARAAIEAKLFSGPRQPVRVGRYRILGRIGSGGMGVVYRAHDPELARDVAVKVVNPETGAGHEHARARLVREARAMARLAHPNVIHVYDVGTVEDGVFIAMELVEGHSLAAWLRQGEDGQPHPWRETLRLFVDAGRGLAAAHAAGVIHRDFKPHNVLVGEDGRVRVGDFGLAGGDASGPTGPHVAVTEPGSDPGEREVLDEPSDLDRASLSGALTRTGMLLGTPKYMPPEQESGAPASARSDQFSFCVALYEALYGRPPYAGDSVSAYRHHVRHGDVLPPPVDSRVRAWVHAEIVRGLAVDPAERHPGMDALLDRLDAALEDPRAIRRRRRRMRILGIGGLASGLVALVAWRLGAGEPELPPAAPRASVPAGEPASGSGAGSGAAGAELAGMAATAAVEAPPGDPAPALERESAESAGSVVAPDMDPSADPPPHEDAAPLKPPEATPRPAPERKTKGHAKSGGAHRAGQGVCYFKEDKYELLGRTRKRRIHVMDDGTCWNCSRAPSAHVIATLVPSDCADYYLCFDEESADKCSE